MSNRRGRRPARGATATASVQIRLTVQERRDLEAAARENHNTSLADAIREAINNWAADFCERRLIHSVVRKSSQPLS